ncbi:hypothetical protein GOBAR_AA23596 [Gossypium barbadense]|uniref:Uncharacterized protein n=1 Tax=Gossypium barbadense TaxID=3634 RepID=A0A2P5X189_GOSBA|nr:hypothetical protein GOBAR_AA23596 [Gossypium barbadense]
MDENYRHYGVLDEGAEGEVGDMRPRETQSRAGVFIQLQSTYEIRDSNTDQAKNFNGVRLDLLRGYKPELYIDMEDAACGRIDTCFFPCITTYNQQSKSLCSGSVAFTAEKYSLF